ncbi:poly(A) RNA polymerase GLD2-B-like [Dendronephthya gigantea]|uniref:poly(A) RNA polymerase GLD2-B-like n=1 Tax=Dendronephthya gigantea TaxID=151771 RepID=UPI001069DB33|nr:poly(A) RNA polymerase GLD2-B-like [Dendronephthya gigantea]
MHRRFEAGSSRSLSEDITRRFEAIQEEKKENDGLKKAWVDELQSIARQKYPNAELVLTGSSGNMFGFKTSDCDLTLISADRFGCSALDNIDKLLPRSRYNTQLVRGAKVPVLKIKDRRSLFEADINNERVPNIRHTYLFRCYALLDPRVLPLGLVIKLWAKNAGIINQRDHKLSGFTLLVLYINYLQKGCSPPVVPSLQTDYPSLFSATLQPSVIIDCLKTKELPEELKHFKSFNKQSLGELFVGFFRFYASFNWSSRVVSISRSDGYVTNNRPRMKIEDPYEPGANSARGIYESYAFSQITNAFSNALRKLDGGMGLESVL